MTDFRVPNSEAWRHVVAQCNEVSDDEFSDIASACAEIFATDPYSAESAYADETTTDEAAGSMAKLTPPAAARRVIPFLFRAMCAWGASNTDPATDDAAADDVATPYGALINIAGLAAPKAAAVCSLWKGVATKAYPLLRDAVVARAATPGGRIGYHGAAVELASLKVSAGDRPDAAPVAMHQPVCTLTVPDPACGGAGDGIAIDVTHDELYKLFCAVDEAQRAVDGFMGKH